MTKAMDDSGGGPVQVEVSLVIQGGADSGIEGYDLAGCIQKRIADLVPDEYEGFRVTLSQSDVREIEEEDDA